MSQYCFTKSGLAKVFILDIRLKETFTFYEYLDYTDPNLVIVTKTVLDETEQANLTAFITNYVEPTVYLQLNSTVSNPTLSKKTNSQVPFTVITWILSRDDQKNSGAVFNSLKTVVSYDTDNITQFVNNTNATLTFDLCNYNTNNVLYSTTVNISNILQIWETMANNNETGSGTLIKSLQIEGLRNVLPSDDTIIQIKLSISNPNIYVRLNGLQMLYYDLL